MNAISRARPQPLVSSRIFVPTRSKYQFIRLKDCLSNALSGNRGSNLFSTAAGQESAAQRHGIFGGTLDTNVRSGSIPGFGGPESAGLDGTGSHSRRSSIALSAGGPRQNMGANMTGQVRKPSLSAQSVASAS